ncbi:MAG: DASS family sodium-coupled anion symporter, partial [Flammeovirgaceae bacterium]|nr:DASS family sodium-coupled anion symporter [Flammeovirgaceae bacterium]
MNKYLKHFLVFIVPTIIFLLPQTWIPLDGITIVEQRVIAIFIFAALSWILEPIPIHATSVTIITLELILISDKGLRWLITGYDTAHFGKLLPYTQIMATFASPIILLFLGGFFLAVSAHKYGLDKTLARLLLKPFGSRPSTLMLGMMAITATFSMFMSNTATTAMMISILTPIFGFIDPEDKIKTGFALSIPIAANLGGIATPIGTPPNAIAMRYLIGEHAVSFLQWMLFGIPFVITLLLIAWTMLRYLYPSQQKEIRIAIPKNSDKKTYHTYIVYSTFWITLILWFTDFWHGLNASTVAMIPVAVFSATGVISKDDLKYLSWDVLWLVAGGIAIGDALEASGLAARIIDNIPFEEMPALLIAIAFGILTLFMANFMSNTATTNLIMPLAVALGASLPSLQLIGGLK